MRLWKSVARFNKVLAVASLMACGSGSAFAAQSSLLVEPARTPSGSGTELAVAIASIGQTATGGSSNGATHSRETLDAQVWDAVTGEEASGSMAPFAIRGNSSAGPGFSSNPPQAGLAEGRNRWNETRVGFEDSVGTFGLDTLGDTEVIVPDLSDLDNTSPSPIPLPASVAMGGSLFALMLTRRNRPA